LLFEEKMRNGWEPDALSQPVKPGRMGFGRRSDQARHSHNKSLQDDFAP
jgi:hypothetical protein